MTIASFARINPPVLGLFEKRIEGDDSLLELARLRFRQAGLGAEMHAGTPEQLEHLLTFRPVPQAAVAAGVSPAVEGGILPPGLASQLPSSPPVRTANSPGGTPGSTAGKTPAATQPPIMVHLPRDFSLLQEDHQHRIREFAAVFAGRVLGFVIHDERELDGGKYVRAAHQMNARLASLPRSPKLFIEYAAGLEPAIFAGFFQTIRDLPCLSACLDSGHVGIARARKTFYGLHRGRDVCGLKSHPPELAAFMDDVELAARSALAAVLDLVDSLGQWGKPVHFHLHDGHPLSTFSPFGVSDHLSFLGEIPLPFEHRGRRSAPLMFGPRGLARIVNRAVEKIGRQLVSFTLEIHPTFEQLPLGDAAALFRHWMDKTNAEKMNHWLSILTSNQKLLVESLGSASTLTPHPSAPPRTWATRP